MRLGILMFEISNIKCIKMYDSMQLLKYKQMTTINSISNYVRNSTASYPPTGGDYPHICAAFPNRRISTYRGGVQVGGTALTGAQVERPLL